MLFFFYFHFSSIKNMPGSDSEYCKIIMSEITAVPKPQEAPKMIIETAKNWATYIKFLCSFYGFVQKHLSHIEEIYKERALFLKEPGLTLKYVNIFQNTSVDSDKGVRVDHNDILYLVIKWIVKDRILALKCNPQNGLFHLLLLTVLAFIQGVTKKLSIQKQFYPLLFFLS